MSSAAIAIDTLRVNLITLLPLETISSFLYLCGTYLPAASMLVPHKWDLKGNGYISKGINPDLEIITSLERISHSTFSYSMVNCNHKNDRRNS